MTNTASDTPTARRLPTVTIERAFDVLSHTRFNAGITHNLLVDAFREALDTDSDVVMLGKVELEALESALDVRLERECDHDFLGHLADLFETL